MNCRLCDTRVESQDPLYQGLCRACGQKRERYIAALVSNPSVMTNEQVPSGSGLMFYARLDDVILFAERIVQADRSPREKKAPS
jgi:hypothetical protein